MRISDWSSDGGSSDLVGPHHQVDEVFGVDRVWIGMAAAEVGQRRRIHHDAFGRTERIFQNRLGVGAGNRVHRIEAQGEAGGEEGAERAERSEEQTSEIQSIQRRSYDVFCMKKNTNTKNT